MSTRDAKLHQNVMYCLQTWPAVMSESVRISFTFPDVNWVPSPLRNASADSTGALGLRSASLSWVGFPGPRTCGWDPCPQISHVSWGRLFIRWSPGVGMRKDKVLKVPKAAGLPKTTKGEHLELMLEGRSSYCDLFLPPIKNGAIVAQFSREFKHTEFTYAYTSEDLMRGI